MGLDPVPPGDHPGQLVIGGTRVPVILPGRLLQELGQREAPGRDIQRLAGREPRRPAGIHPRETLRRSGHPRTPPPGRHSSGCRHRRGLPQPGHHRRDPRLLGGDLVRGGDQLPGIHVRRRRVVRVLVQVQVLILGPGGQVRRVIHPVRPGRHPAGVLVPPGVPGNRSLVHVPRSVRMKNLIRIQYLKMLIDAIRHAGDCAPDLRSTNRGRSPEKRARMPADLGRQAVGRVRTWISSPTRLEPVLRTVGGM